MVTAEAAARYLLWLASREPEEELVTQMRLHKLLYYAQGWALASRGKPLFESAIQAWRHGPVVKEVYPKFRDCKGSPIPSSEARSGADLSDDDRAFLEWVWGLVGPYSAAELRRRTHAEAPWKSARGLLPEDANSEAPISIESMREHFLGEYRHFLKRNGFDPDQYLAALEDVRCGRTVPFDQTMAELIGGVEH